MSGALLNYLQKWMGTNDALTLQLEKDYDRTWNKRDSVSTAKEDIKRMCTKPVANKDCAEYLQQMRISYSIVMAKVMMQCLDPAQKWSAQQKSVSNAVALVTEKFGTDKNSQNFW
jgi:hypothetical protein